MQQLDAILEKSDADFCKSWAAREGDSKGEPKHIQTGGQRIQNEMKRLLELSSIIFQKPQVHYWFIGNHLKQ
jgi:hypothetical protein